MDGVQRFGDVHRGLWHCYRSLDIGVLSYFDRQFWHSNYT
jgi:hypothetical protein